jgi:surfeit locus 1 family protein
MKFVFRPGAAAATAFGVAILIALGAWQFERREWKLGLIERVEARAHSAPIAFDEALARAAAGEDMEYQRVRISGVYAHDLEAHVFGTLGGEPGVYVFTPLDAPAADGGRRFIYVNRGFTPQALADPALRGEGQATSEVHVEGLFRTTEKPSWLEKLFRPVDQLADNLWFRRDPEVLATRHHIETVPYYVDSSGKENPASWPKGGTTRVEFYNKHLEYAVTWFGLAAALVGVFAAYSIKKG